MNVQNLPEVVRLKKPQTCYCCGKKINKGQNAVFHWWIKPISKAYDHMGCTKKKK